MGQVSCWVLADPLGAGRGAGCWALPVQDPDGPDLRCLKLVGNTLAAAAAGSAQLPPTAPPAAPQLTASCATYCCRYHPGMDEVVLELNPQSGRVEMEVLQVSSGRRWGMQAVLWASLGAAGMRHGVAGGGTAGAASKEHQRRWRQSSRQAAAGCACMLPDLSSLLTLPLLSPRRHRPPRPDRAAQPGTQEAVHAGPAARCCRGA